VYRAKDLLAVPVLSPDLCAVQWRGGPVSRKEGTFVHQARIVGRVDHWNLQAMRLFACDCVENVLGVYETMHPRDRRPHDAIRTARAFVRGECDLRELSRAREKASAAERDNNRGSERRGDGNIARAAAIAAAPPGEPPTGFYPESFAQDRCRECWFVVGVLYNVHTGVAAATSWLLEDGRQHTRRLSRIGDQLTGLTSVQAGVISALGSDAAPRMLSSAAATAVNHEQEWEAARLNWLLTGGQMSSSAPRSFWTQFW
jgi:hypothetical protein